MGTSEIFVLDDNIADEITLILYVLEIQEYVFRLNLGSLGGFQDHLGTNAILKHLTWWPIKLPYKYIYCIYYNIAIYCYLFQTYFKKNQIIKCHFK